MSKSSIPHPAIGYIITPVRSTPLTHIIPLEEQDSAFKVLDAVATAAKLFAYTAETILRQTELDEPCTVPIALRASLFGFGLTADQEIALWMVLRIAELALGKLPSVVQAKEGLR